MKTFDSLQPGLVLPILVGAIFATACGSSSPDPLPAEQDGGPPDTCQLTPARAWVVEGEELNVTLSCKSGLSLSDLRIDDLPEGLVFDAATTSLRWTPTLDQAAVYHLPLHAPSLGAEGDLLIGVADAYDAPGNVPIVDSTKYTMELGLPVIFLASEPASDSAFEPMTITYGGVVFEAEAKLRGKSSLDYPKKSYALRFDKFSSFSETEFANFGNRTRVVLTSTFDDNSYIRQRMAFNLWSALDPSIPIEAYSAVVYRGTEYRGLYTVTDHINAELMKRNGLSEDANVYKAEDHDANFKTTANDGSAKSTLHQGYSKTEGDPIEGEPQAFADLEALVDFVANTDDATFNGGIEALIDVDDYVAWWLHATFTLAYDSAGKNSYHYHDQLRSWRVVPWDFNSSFGQQWETSRATADDYEPFFNRNRLFERLLAHPTLGPQIDARYRDLLDNGALSASKLNAMIDGYMDEIGLSAARDWTRWQSEYLAFDRWYERSDFTSHLEEVQYLRSWVTERWQFVRDNYTSDL